MPAVLNTNMASLYAQKSLSTAQADLAGSVQKLSSGKRINSAKDDAAGYAVAEAVKATKNVTDQSIQNTQDAISLVQTAEGALDVVSKILQRALTLTTEKANSSLTATQTTSINTELTSLFSQIADIKSRTKFQGGDTSIFGRSNLSFQTGDGTTTSFSIADLTLASLNSSSTTSATTIAANVTLTGSALADSAAFTDVGGYKNGTATTGAQIVIANQFSTGLTSKFAVGQILYDTNGTTRLGRIAAIDAIDVTTADAIKITLEPGTTTLVAGTTYTVKTAGELSASTSTASDLMLAVQNNIVNRAALGATQNSLNYIVDNMQTLSNNLADAQSRIVDTNYAAETANLTRGQILQQAATSMLAQANQMPNVILTLLK